MSTRTVSRTDAVPARRWALIGMALAALSGTLAAIRSDASAASVVLRVDLNTAPSAVLESLPRIGPAMAARIVAAREVLPFAGLDDFDRRVSGIGPVTRAALAPHLRFDGE